MNIVITPDERAEIERQLRQAVGYGSPSAELVAEVERIDRRRRLPGWIATVLGALFVAAVAAAAVGLP